MVLSWQARRWGPLPTNVCGEVRQGFQAPSWQAMLHRTSYLQAPPQGERASRRIHTCGIHIGHHTVNSTLFTGTPG